MDCKSKMEDSDLLDRSSKGVVRDLRLASYKSTPTSSRVFSRKRKSHSMEQNLSPDHHFMPFRDIASPPSSIDSSFNDSYASINDSKSSDSPYYEISFINNEFKRSSPYNKTGDFVHLSSSLKKCSLLDLECFDESQLAKRCRWDNENVNTHRKSNSAPGTPQRPEIETDVYVKKCYSLEFTPTKGSQVKIGTPERNKILYPQLMEVNPETKPKSPQKLRSELKRLSKPARKRLFTTRDFVILFTKVKDQRDVLSHILSYLPDRDLVNVAKVSKLWKNCLEMDSMAFQRYKNYIKMVTISKENLYETSLNDSKNTSIFSTKKNNCETPVVCSPPTSPSRENWRKFAKLGTTIDASQRLTKCILCSHPAVIEKHIAQCSRTSCLYIWCTKCLSGTKTGPTDFVCVCIDAKSPQSPRHLTDISNNTSMPSFFVDTSISAGNANSSSGYFSQSDHERSSSILQNTSSNFSRGSKSKHTVLTDWNKIYTTPRRSSSTPVGASSTSFHSVAQQCMKQTINSRKSTYVEPPPASPSSPPKVKLPAVGSKKSKKNLRRLCL